MKTIKFQQNLTNFEDMNINDNEYYFINSNSARAQETVQMDLLVPGDFAYIANLNNAEIREDNPQQFIRRPRPEYKKSQIFCYGLKTICCVFLFSLTAFYICESIIKLQQKHE